MIDTYQPNYSIVEIHLTKKVLVMSYFPMYMDMKNLKVLLIGGGYIATEKLEKLVDFTTNITIITINIEQNAQDIVDKYQLKLHKRAYQMGDIKGFDIVIVATDTISLHKQIYEESRGSRVLVNSVDNREYCDFIFPSYIQKGDLTISFSTGGASPAFAKQIKQHFQNIIPASVGEFLDKMKALRTQLPKGKERMRYFDTLVEDYFKENFKK